MPNPKDPKPADIIEQARLALDPVKSAHTYRVRERLRRWLEGGPNREARLTIRHGVWCIDLLDGDNVAATELRADHDDCLAHAIMTAELG